MILKELSREHTPSVGRGNNHGETFITTYQCPCGQGKVLKEEDTIIGFRQIYVHITCTDCLKKYKILNASSRNWELVPI